METVDLMERSYDKMMSIWKEENDGRLERNDEKLETIERKGLDNIRDGGTMKISAMAQAYDKGVCRSWAARFASHLVNIFKVSTENYFWQLCARKLLIVV